MIKKASDMPSAASRGEITEIARTLPEPADFYKGVRHSGNDLPDNILLFHRTKAANLNNAKGAKAFHQRYVLIVPLSGSGRVIAGAQSIPLGPGRCLLIAPFQFHHYRAISRKDIDWLFITFTWGSHTADASTRTFTTSPAFWLDLRELVRDFRSQHLTRNADRLLWRLALILDHVTESSRSPKQPNAPVMKEKLLLEVCAEASNHLRDPLPVPQLAQKLGMSSSHLRHRFQQIAGISVGRFLREFRLRHAAELLATGQTNVSEASTACGWDTPYSFSRAFRNYWGRPPKSFALAYRE
jgi:AraC family transcriptional regulator